MVESDHRVANDIETQEIKAKIIQENQEYAELSDVQIGLPRKDKGNWGSCIRLVEPVKLQTLDILELQDNETAVSAAIISFTGHDELMLVVGAVKNYIPKPKSFSECYINTYAFPSQGQKVILLHKTPVEDIPLSFAAFKGKVLAGIGKTLRLYEMGKSKLLRKSEQRHFSCGINTINIYGDRIFVTDMSDSFHVLRYRNKESQFYEFADDVLPRWVTSACILDYDTVAGADKFENVFICRLPQSKLNLKTFI